jgi:hypothetical protein
MSETVDEMIVHYADSLHVRIDNGRTNKAEFPPFEILAKRVRLPDGRSLAAPLRILPMLRAGWSEIKRAGALPLNFHPSCSGPAQHGQRFVRTSHKTIPQALDSGGFLDVSRE